MRCSVMAGRWKYAVFPCTLGTIGDAYTFIYQTWFAQSGHQRTEGPEFEYYDATFNANDPDSKMYIYIPIK